MQMNMRARAWHEFCMHTCTPMLTLISWAARLKSVPLALALCEVKTLEQQHQIKELYNCRQNVDKVFG